MESHTAEQRLTKTVSGALKGKFGYFSPEQVRGEPLDHRSDIFSLGIVCYEMVVGKRPFPLRASELEILTRIEACDYPSPAEAAPDLPRGVTEIIEKAMERDPTRRFQTADSFVEAIEAFAARSGLSLSTRNLSRYLSNLVPRKQDRSTSAGPCGTDAFGPISLTSLSTADTKRKLGTHERGGDDTILDSVSMDLVLIRDDIGARNPATRVTEEVTNRSDMAAPFEGYTAPATDAPLAPARPGETDSDEDGRAERSMPGSTSKRWRVPLIVGAVLVASGAAVAAWSFSADRDDAEVNRDNALSPAVAPDPQDSASRVIETPSPIAPTAAPQRKHEPTAVAVDPDEETSPPPPPPEDSADDPATKATAAARATTANESTGARERRRRPRRERDQSKPRIKRAERRTQTTSAAKETPTPVETNTKKTDTDSSWDHGVSSATRRSLA